MKRMRRLGVLVFLGPVLMTFSACAGSYGRLPKKGPSFSQELRHEMVESMKSRNRVVSTLRSLASVRYGNKVLGAKGDAALLIRRPYDLRIDGLSEFGLYDLRLVLSSGTLRIFWPTEGRYFEGMATPETLRRFLSVALDAEVAIDLLSGTVTLEDEEEYILKTRKKGLEFVLRGVTSELVLEKREGGFLPLRYTAFDVDGSRRYVIDYSQYVDLGGLWFPGKLVARFREPRSRLEIQFHGTELNPQVDQDLFELKIPDDASPVPD